MDNISVEDWGIIGESTNITSKAVQLGNISSDK
jgi:hypothetical protein